MNGLTVNSTGIVSWGVLEPVRRVQDMWLDGQPVTLNPPSGAIAQFEACTACPSCELLAVHGWREPRILPPCEFDRDAAMSAGLSGLNPACQQLMESGGPIRFYFVHDESRFSVVRQCAGCGHEWGQA